MPNLTTKELGLIKDHLSAEQAAVTKFRSFAEMAHDAELSDQYNAIADTHQKHYDKLVSYLG